MNRGLHCVFTCDLVIKHQMTSVGQFHRPKLYRDQSLSADPFTVSIDWVRIVRTRYHTKRGSAWHIVREVRSVRERQIVRQGERERERERETKTKVTPLE